jgi:hypothetical protein
MCGRGGVGVRVLSDTSGAPARFIPLSQEIDIQRKLIAHLDPKDVASSDFAIKNASLFGAVVHEASHAAESQMDLESIYKTYGPRHFRTFQMLEEARCETQNQHRLTALQKAGLRACILEIVLRDMQIEDSEQMSEEELAIRLVGLIGGRIVNGLIPSSNEHVSGLIDQATSILGPNYQRFLDLTRKFSAQSTDTWDNYVDKLNVIVSEWIELEDEILPEDSVTRGGGGGGGQPGDEDEDETPSGGGGGGEGEGEDEAEGQSPQSGGEDGSEPASKTGELTDTPQDGNNPNQEHEIVEHTGGDATGLVDNGRFSTVENPNLAEMLDALADAAETVKQDITKSEVGPALTATNRATRTAHEERRRRNREAQKRWNQE